MAKKPEKSKTNGADETAGPDIDAFASELEREFGENLSQSFDLLGRGLLNAIEKTRETVDALQQDLRAQSADTGEAVGKADQLGETLQTLQEELSSRLSDEQLQSRIESFAQDAMSRLEEELSEELRKLEADHQALDEKYDRVTREEDFLEDIVDENMDIVRRYKPGRIDVLEQEVERLEEERNKLQERLTGTNAKLDAAQRHNIQLLAQDDVADRAEVEAKLEKLARLREDQENVEVLRAERDELKERLEALEKLRERYEAHQEAVERDRHLKAELRQEKDAREKLEEKYRDAKHARTTATKKVKQLESAVNHLRQRITDSEMEVAKLERELESFREREAQLEEKRDEYLNKLQGLKEREEELEQELADRLEELEAQMDRTLAEKRKQLRSEVETELEREYSDQLEKLKRLEHVETKLEELRGDYREATSELVAWEREVSKRETQKAAEEENIERLQERVVELDVEKRERKEELTALKEEIAATRVERTELQAKVDALRERFEGLDEELDAEYEKRRKRLEQEYQQRRGELDADRETRIEPIHEGAFDLEKVRSAPRGLDENEWLDGIVDKIEEADFHFPRRLIEAFHTSLKIAEWAPLTVLAGVSGTGKSELPRLYSMFGGLHHKMLSVQPNWDSPQDLFGFFNYMDNRYKATELLQALVQSQKSPEDGGFSDQMLLVLLDEMNLARVELYFSEFLSKLEARRGLQEENIPYIGVDIGSGLKEEKVHLGPNVLFVGTMNEDETTNALSDKVLDRGNVITFPRPTNLHSRGRPVLKAVDTRLQRQTWESWQVEPADGLSDDVRTEIRDFMNGVNVALSRVHRAIGHRVLQAIENYVANHPTVAISQQVETDENWQRALGDQVVQKIMPKLRGVETDTERGRACLDEVARLLDEFTPELSDDFKRARDAGYGTFIWSSAEYLIHE